MRDIIKSVDFTQSRKEYFTDILQKIFEKVKGNVVEIGAGFGENTETFLQVAAEYGREVLVIDPFESDWDNMPKGYQYPFTKFWANVKRYDNLALHKYASQHPSCFKRIMEFSPIAFTFVDGLQSKEAVLSDLALMVKAHASVICVDDANRLTGQSEVPLALKEFQSDYEIITQDREAYLCL